MDAKTLCLGSLMLGDASGYEIKKLMEEGCFAHFHAVGFGSIYPALAQLSGDGAVTYYVDSQDGRPDRKVYRITDTGRERFRRALHARPAPDRVRSDTVFMMFFADLLDKGHLDKVYEGYLAQYKALIAEIEGLDNTDIPAGRLWARGLGLAFYRAAADYLENNREMLFAAPEKSGDGALADSNRDPELVTAGDKS